MNSPHPNFGSKDDIFLLLEDLGGEPTLERWASHSLNVISSRLPSQQRQLLQHSPQLQSSQQRQSPPSWFFDLHLLQGLLLMMSASSLHLFILHSVLGQTTQTAWHQIKNTTFVTIWRLALVNHKSHIYIFTHTENIHSYWFEIWNWP